MTDLQAAAASWEQHMVAAREHSTNTILPVCAMLQNQVTDASDLIEREVTAFLRTPDNRQYLFPAFPQVWQSVLPSCGIFCPVEFVRQIRSFGLTSIR